jgi:hypothetical protein
MKPAKNRIITETREAATPAAERSPAVVTVRVVRQPVGENGRTYFAGEEIQTTPERAAALGSLVTK